MSQSLQVDDEEFLVASLIDRCPKTMMLRELLQNAVEAARLTAGGAGWVWIKPVEIEGARKLSIRNTGPGMDAPTLRKMGDIAASIGKVKSLTENFGMGGKVASLPSNPLGIRYRSCARGQAHEIVMGKFNGIYGRRLRAAPSGEMTDVLDVSSAYCDADLAQDWTEVVLMGSHVDQDTTADPYNGDPFVRDYWIPETIYRRFLRLPANVRIDIAEGLHWFEGPRQFETLADRWDRAFARYEAVSTASGLTVHFLYDPAHSLRPWENASSEGALQTSHSFAAIAYRNEFYDVRLGAPWVYDGPKCGIGFGGRHISVIVELPDDYHAVPDIYRQFLRYASAEQTEIKFVHFAREVQKSRPKWMNELLDVLAQNAAPSMDVLSSLSSFRKELGVLLYKHVERDYKSNDKGWREPELEIIQLKDQQDINDRWLDGRAGCFYPETNQLFVNCRYEAIGQLTEELGRLAASDGAIRADAQSLGILLHAVACEQIVRRLARSVFYGLLKRADPDRWQQGHIEKALSPEALSTVADEWRDLAPLAMIALRRQLGVFAPEGRPHPLHGSVVAAMSTPATVDEQIARPKIRRIDYED